MTQGWRLGRVADRDKARYPRAKTELIELSRAGAGLLSRAMNLSPTRCPLTRPAPLHCAPNRQFISLLFARANNLLCLETFLNEKLPPRTVQGLVWEFIKPISINRYTICKQNPFSRLEVK